MTTPEGLFPGPDVDGRPTWYGQYGDIPGGWEYRTCTDIPWEPIVATPPLRYVPAAIMQARPVAPPDPTWLTVETFPDGRWVAVPATWVTADGHTAGVTTVGEMRDRTDLDQWQYADNDPYAPGWSNWADWRAQSWDRAPADLPVAVRRRS